MHAVLTPTQLADAARAAGLYPSAGDLAPIVAAERAKVPNGGRDWVLEITVGAQRMPDHTGRFADSVMAAHAGRALVAEDAQAVKVNVRPLIERTEMEGRLRYPHALHAEATMAAYTGWLDAQFRVQQQVAADRAQFREHDVGRTQQPFGGAA